MLRFAIFFLRLERIQLYLAHPFVIPVHHSRSTYCSGNKWTTGWRVSLAGYTIGTGCARALPCVAERIRGSIFFLHVFLNFWGVVLNFAWFSLCFIENKIDFLFLFLFFGRETHRVKKTQLCFRMKYNCASKRWKAQLGFAVYNYAFVRNTLVLSEKWKTHMCFMMKHKRHKICCQFFIFVFLFQFFGVMFFCFPFLVFLFQKKCPKLLT